MRIRNIKREEIKEIRDNYVNSLPGVSVVLTGVKSVGELNENLKYLTQQGTDQDFSSLIEFFRNDTN